MCYVCIQLRPTAAASTSTKSQRGTEAMSLPLCSYICSAEGCGSEWTQAFWHVRYKLKPDAVQHSGIFHMVHLTYYASRPTKYIFLAYKIVIRIELNQNCCSLLDPFAFETTPFLNTRFAVRPLWWVRKLLQLLAHNGHWTERNSVFFSSPPLCWEASVFLSTEETSNPVFTRGGVTPRRLQATIKPLGTVQTKSRSVLTAACAVICLLHDHFWGITGTP